MRKRIRLKDLQIGMFVEDDDFANTGGSEMSGAFRVSSSDQVESLIKSPLMSVVINTEKGCDLQPPSRRNRAVPAGTFKAEMISRYSVAEAEAAEEAINDIAPHVRQILVDVRLGQDISFQAINETTDRVLSAAFSNSGAFLTLLQLKTKDTGAFLHSIAVSALMVTFGSALGLSDEEIRGLGVAGLVHDIGKMCLPPTLLSKSGALSPSELAVTRTHPQLGYDLLKTIPDIHSTALDVTRYHHEKYDGTGYPDRLIGAAIPIGARIAAICDVYDALTTVRPYKRAWTQAEAVDFMLRSNGHFDPSLLRTFVSHMIISGTLSSKS